MRSKMLCHIFWTFAKKQLSKAKQKNNRKIFTVNFVRRIIEKRLEEDFVKKTTEKKNQRKLRKKKN